MRSPVSHAQLAALRIGKYWNRRIELFGNNRAFKPLHLGGDGALSSTHGTDDKDDEAMVEHTMKGLEIGFVRPTRTHDAGGRAILFVDPSRLSKYNKNNSGERLGVARAVWYVMHNAFEGNDAVQKLGKRIMLKQNHQRVPEPFLERRAPTSF